MTDKYIRATYTITKEMRERIMAEAATTKYGASASAVVRCAVQDYLDRQDAGRAKPDDGEAVMRRRVHVVLDRGLSFVEGMDAIQIAQTLQRLKGKMGFHLQSHDDLVRYVQSWLDQWKDLSTPARDETHIPMVNHHG